MKFTTKRTKMKIIKKDLNANKIKIHVFIQKLKQKIRC